MEPENPQAHIALCRIALARKRFGLAARRALAAIESACEDPLPHFLLGRALAARKHYTRAAQAFLTAISLNPNFPEAHEHLARTFRRLGELNAAREHRGLAEEMRSGEPCPAPVIESPSPSRTPGVEPVAPLPEESLTVVTGLPRSGTSMRMQMLAAGDFPVLTDGIREPDEDNPRGYLELDRVKRILSDSTWLPEARGKAVKIVAPLLSALPCDLPCRVILLDRDLDEVLDSQQRTLERLDPGRVISPERRETLRSEYIRTLERIRQMLSGRANARLLVIEHREAIRTPLQTVERISQFMEYDLDVIRMAAAVDPALYRNRHPHVER